MLEVAC